VARVRFIADENFKAAIVRGLLRRQINLDIVRVQDVGLSGADDPRVLAWAAQTERVLSLFCYYAGGKMKSSEVKLLWLLG